ncbi:hypothetical protein [Saccharopolyspora cebuensis]|uniref:Uncharacterized protein n=1 Tax=Saccharopolyspora cebuensis TaxID=418759 RepID=A0ABV4CI51_9PSEU
MGAERERLVAEIRLLLDALAERAEGYLRACRDLDPQPDGCGWCPVCAAVSLLRGQSPSAMTEQLAGIVRALREALAEHVAEPGPEPAEESAEPDVQRIDVRRVGGPVLRDEGVAAQC